MRDNEPSATARLIARSQLMLAGDPALGWAVGTDRASVYRAAIAAAAGRDDGRLSFADRIGLAVAEAAGVRGIYLHYALRKLRIEQIVRQRLATAPVKQVVVIAAGFDPLALLLHRDHPDLKCFEVDHPATQRCKRAAIESLGAGANLSLLPLDLVREPLSSLFGRGQIEQEPTLVIAEGLSMYLTESQIDGLFRDIRRGTLAGSSALLMTYMNRREGGRIDFESTTPLAKAWLALKREKFVWGVEASALAGFASARGYGLAGHWDPDSQRADYLSPRALSGHRLAHGENIALLCPGA
ncbi:MAG: class I SAM-dependent methyltransferase [Proteobacteria bacterium]|nr:class I SAM-dependent methyltransferase [Pseudomonadota bacterium]